MIIIPLLCLLGFGLIVALVGLFVLAYSKKEALGKTYKIASYATVTVGTLICAHALIFAIVFSTCHSSCYGHSGFKGHYGMHEEHEGRCRDNHSCDADMYSRGEGHSCSSKKEMHCEKSCSHEGTMMEKEVVVKVIEGEEAHENNEVKK